MEKKIIDYIVVLLKKKINTKNVIYSDLKKINYSNSQILDSLETLKFHLNLEKKFKIRFSPKDLISKDIKTFGGIARIIIKKLKK